MMTQDCQKVQAVLEVLGQNGNGNCCDCSITLSLDTANVDFQQHILVCGDCSMFRIGAASDKSFTNQDDEPLSPVKYVDQKFVKLQGISMWSSEQFEQYKLCNNNAYNSKMMSKVKSWVYRPRPADDSAVKMKWVNWRLEEESEMFLDVPRLYQTEEPINFNFQRLTKNGIKSCCASVKNEELLCLTYADSTVEEIPLKHIETVGMNSQRTTRDNGLEILYRVNNDPNNVRCLFLCHEQLDVAYSWVCLILYLKFKTYMAQSSSTSEEDVSGFLNSIVQKNMYLSMPKLSGQRPLCYFALSETRLSCFENNLDVKPKFTVVLTKGMNLQASEYVDALVNYMDADPNKFTCFNHNLGKDSEWFLSIEMVLNTDKFSLIPGDLTSPVVPVKVPITQHQLSSSEKDDASDLDKSSASSSSQVSSTPTMMMNSTGPILKNGDMPNPKSEAACYPPIGPMGEMGKVARGEIPAEAIKPQPAKVDITRAYDLNGSSGIAGLKPSEGVGCYPPITPITGGQDLLKLQYAAQNNPAAAALRRDGDFHSLPNGAVTAANLLNITQNQKLFGRPGAIGAAAAAAASGHGMLDARMGFGRFNPADLAHLQQFSGYDDAVVQNQMLTLHSLQQLQRTAPALNGFDARGLATPSYDHLLAWRPVDVHPQQQPHIYGRFASTPRNNWHPNPAANAALGGDSSWIHAALNANAAANPTTDPFAVNRLIATQQAAAAQISPDLAAALNLNLTISNPSTPAAVSTTAAAAPVPPTPLPITPQTPAVSASNKGLVDNVLNRAWSIAEPNLMILLQPPTQIQVDKSIVKELQKTQKTTESAADTCMLEIYDFVLQQKWAIVICFFKSFVEYFQSSTQNMMVHQYFSGDSEINLLRKIFLKVGSIQINMPNGYEKLEPLLNSASGARSQGNGTAPTTTPSTTTAAANNLANSVVESQHPPPSSSSWPTTLASSTHNGVSSNADAWLTSSSVAPSSSAANNNVFSFPTASSSNSNDFLRWSTSTPISDVWSNSSLLPSHQNPPPSAPGTFNRAPSRPESSTSPPKTNGSGANNTQVDYTSPFFTPPSSSSADIDEMLNQRKFF